jgi:hypothetical protein
VLSAGPFYTEVSGFTGELVLGRRAQSSEAAPHSKTRCEFDALFARGFWNAPVLWWFGILAQRQKAGKGGIDQLTLCCGFLLWRLFRWRWPRRGSSQRCFFPSQISQSPFALGSYSVLLSHGISID